jgi:hypothetical protein
MKETRVTFSKFENDKQIAYGEVYVPFVPDSQGDFMTPTEIERIAHNFLRRGKVSAIDTEHNLMKNGSVVVESFIARENDPDFLPGSWVLGIHIPNRQIWDMAKSGDLGGFSMYGSGRREQRVVEIEIPDDGTVFGKTAEGGFGSVHRHVFALDFDERGTFTGGETSEADGHTHKILKGTVTEPGGADGHRHRFALVDAMLAKGDDLTPEEKAWRQSRIEKADMSQADLEVAGNASPEQGNPLCEDCPTPKKCKNRGCQGEKA